MHKLFVGIALIVAGLAIMFLVKSNNIYVPIAGLALVVVGGIFLQSVRRTFIERTVQKYAKK